VPPLEREVNAMSRESIKECVGRYWKVVVVTAVIAVFLTLGSLEAERYFSSTGFCVSCHSMSYVDDELKESTHFDSAIGSAPDCQDCHLPPQFYLRVESHIVDGIRAFIGEFKHDLSTKEEFDKYRADYAHNARMRLKQWNSSPCTAMCHKNPVPSSDEAEVEHRKMKTEGATCIDCHQNIVHEEVPEEDLVAGKREGRIVLKPSDDEDEDEDEEDEEEEDE
jgi:nitrate/TMAO reductase-like tetraheme cytochrome c subunit